MPDKTLLKKFTDGATLTGFAAGIGYLVKKGFNKSFTADPSNSFENFALFTLVMTGSVWLKQYLEDQKILPNSV